MGFSLLRWKKSGRDWSRREPPPRGSVEYCKAPKVFQPPPSTSSGKIWEITATELDAANRWVTTLARSVDYARQVHGDSVLSAQDALDFVDFHKRWKKLTSKVTTWSIIERSRESNKAVFEALLAESNRLRDRFSKTGMVLIPAPHMTDLVLLLRRLPPKLSPRDMAARLETVAKWGRSMLNESRTTGEWVQKIGMYAAGATLLGPAGMLFAHHMPTSWAGDQKGLVKAIDDAQHAAKILARSASAGVSYERGSPVYDELVRRATKVYIEAAGLFGVIETQASAMAEAVDAGGKPLERGGDTLLWLLVLAGASYLGGRWIESRARVPEPEGSEPESEGDVAVPDPRDEVLIEGDEEDEKEYDENDEQNEVSR
jgi:hypothetical protein